VIVQAGERDSKLMKCYLDLLLHTLTCRKAGGRELKIVGQKGRSPVKDFRK
jgi:hypothetical protein